MIVATSKAIIKPQVMVVLGFDTPVANLTVVAALGVPYSTYMTIFDVCFKIDIVGSWSMNQSLTI
jgi:hypothetical protein